MFNEYFGYWTLIPFQFVDCFWCTQKKKTNIWDPSTYTRHNNRTFRQQKRTEFLTCIFIHFKCVSFAQTSQNTAGDLWEWLWCLSLCYRGCDKSFIDFMNNHQAKAYSKNENESRFTAGNCVYADILFPAYVQIFATFMRVNEWVCVVLILFSFFAAVFFLVWFGLYILLLSLLKLFPPHAMAKSTGFLLWTISMNNGR